MAGRHSRRRVTMADIAAATGLSKMTISRVLNNHPYVSRETRSKVEAAIRKLHFQPNILARRFFTGKTHLVVVVAPIEYMFRSWYFKDLFQGVFERTEEAGYDVLFQNSASRRKLPAEKCLEMVKGRLVEGALLVAPMTHDYYPRELTEQDVPLVVLGESVCGPSVNRVLPPNKAVSAQMTRYLLKRGHRRIALLTFDPTHAESNEREVGFREAMAEAGLAVDPMLIVPAQYDRATAFHKVQALFTQRRDVTAVFALNADMGFGAADALRALNLRVPEDVSLVVFDDGPELERWDPPLTAIRQHPFEIGYAGCDLLLRLLSESSPQRRKPQTIIIDAQIMERKSVATLSGTAR
jgi:LacI family transcriptional regulator